MPDASHQTAFSAIAGSTRKANNNAAGSLDVWSMLQCICCFEAYAAFSSKECCTCFACPGSMQTAPIRGRWSQLCSFLRIVEHAIYMTHTWHIHDTYMTYTWHIHDIYMTYTWHIHDIYMTSYIYIYVNILIYYIIYIYIYMWHIYIYNDIRYMWIHCGLGGSLPSFTLWGTRGKSGRVSIAWFVAWLGRCHVQNLVT